MFECLKKQANYCFRMYCSIVFYASYEFFVSLFVAQIVDCWNMLKKKAWLRHRSIPNSIRVI